MSDHHRKQHLFQRHVLPDLKIIVEPDGRTKFGDNEQEVRENTEVAQRQHDHNNAGWE